MELNTVEGNIVIAAFIGWKRSELSKDGKVHCASITPDEYPQYHKDWNELMPVVDKIEEISKHGGLTHFYWNKNDVTDIRIFRETQEVTWSECVKFIQWYNSQSTTASPDPLS